MPDGLLSWPVSQIHGILMCKFTHLHHAKERHGQFNSKNHRRGLYFYFARLVLCHWYLKYLRGGREASPRKLNISFISYLKIKNLGQVKDHLNWPFKSKIFAHIVRIPFPVM